SGVGIGRELAENRVGKALFFTNILKEARGHASAKKIIEYGDAEAVFVAQWHRWNTNAEMDLFKVALGFEMDGRVRVRSARVFGIVQIHFYFFEDNLAFLFHIFGIESRPEHEVSDDVKSDGQVLVKNLGVETDLFLGGEGIQHAADGIHFARDGFGGAALRA